MPTAHRSAVIAALSAQLQGLGLADHGIGAPEARRFVFGIGAIDQKLKACRFPYGGVHDISGDSGLADFTAASTFVAWIAGQLSGSVLWCVGRTQIYAPALSMIGLSPKKIMFADVRGDDDVLACLEEGARHGALGAVVGEVRQVSLKASRRLLLAAQKTGVAVFLLRPPLRAPKSENVACVTRWRIAVRPSTPLAVPGIGPPQWSIELLRARDGAVGQWIVEAPSASGDFRLSATLAGGIETEALEPQRRSRAS
jgi:protein ImuA